MFFDLVKDFFTNPVILVPIGAWLIAQVLKVIIKLLVDHELSFERLFGDGGMPSGHSATVTSLMVMCGRCCGFGSVNFAISAILAVVVMHDATGVRRETGKQATSIKQIADIINGMFLEKDEAVRTEKLKEFVGHTPVQVFFGSLLGVIVAICAILISGLGYMSVVV